MESDLRLHCILIGGKSSTLDQYLVSLRSRTIERRHHEVQVHGKRIHDDNFRCFGADQRGCLLCKQAVIGHPRIACVKMPFHAECSPLLQLLFDMCARSFRLQPEGVSAQVNALFTGLCLRNPEALAKMRQGIARVECTGEVLSGLKRSVGHEASSRGVSSLRINSSALRQSRSSTRSTPAQSSVNNRSCTAPRLRAVT